MSDRGLLRAWLALSAAALAAFGFLAVSDRDEHTNAPSPPAAAAPAPASAPAQPSTPAELATTVSHASPSGLERQTAAPRARRTDDAAFWRLIDETRSAAGNDTARQSELLEDRLRQFSPRAIVAFARFRHRLDQRAYTWNLWGAATVIEDGCSDDCFRDFRAYVISLGRGAYERALRDPDSLASVAQDAETGDWENADNVAPDAYASVTGEDFPLDDSDLSRRPAGAPLNLDGAALRGHYPRLAARFRG
jgi:Protein of unknown function (DUF4240)